MAAMFNPFSPRQSRIGFHYFPDTLHYRDSDLQTWLLELTSLGASWLVVHSAAERAIPEFFLRALLQTGIEPLVQFDLNPANPPAPGDLATLFEAYARWGVHGVQLFDRPNVRTAWLSSGWAQQELVERFLDGILPASNAALQAGLTPIFPALEPGGDYWDTAFLRAALESLMRRKQTGLLESLVLSAYGWTNDHALDWGAGGPARWPAARAYSNPPGSQDQRGFCIFEWYQAIVQKVLGIQAPILLLQAGNPGSPISCQPLPPPAHARQSHQIASLLAGKSAAAESQPTLTPIPPYVLAANFWLLAADPQDPAARWAWFQDSGAYTASIEALKQQASAAREAAGTAAKVFDPNHPIDHYLLVPTYDWGIADYHLDIIRPFIKRYRPVLGFSLAEARLAREVTVVGNLHSFSEDQLDELRHLGCKVRRINGDGISIATQLSER